MGIHRIPESSPMTTPREAQDQSDPQAVITGLSTRAARAARAVRIYELRYRERYSLERERLAEWIDLGGEEGA